MSGHAWNPAWYGWFEASSGSKPSGAGVSTPLAVRMATHSWIVGFVLAGLIGPYRPAAKVLPRTVVSVVASLV